MNFQQFLLILWARRRIALIVFLVTIISTLAVSLVLPKQYTATSTVVIDVKSPDPIAGMVLPGLMAPGYMATQVDIINSDRVAAKVVEALKLAEDPDNREFWQKKTGGRGEIVNWLAGMLRLGLEVRPSRESDVIEIRFTDTNARRAAEIANAFAEAYIAVNVELRVEPARQYAEYFENQTRLQRERLEAAQTKLSDFQQKYGIVANDERLDFETQRLTEISTRLTQAQNQSSQLKAKEKVGRTETLEDVTSNSLINQLRFEVARAEAKLKELSGNYGVNHPQHQRASAELAELRQRLGSETARITSSVATANRVSQGNATELQAAFDGQKQRVLELRKHRDEISVLMREVDAAQKAFDAVSQRLTQSQLESQSIQSNVSILTRADEPLTHTKPKVLLNVVLAAFLGGMLGIASALILELSQRRIRSAEDLSITIDLPVLAELAPASPVAIQGGWGYFKSRIGRDAQTNKPGKKS